MRQADHDFLHAYAAAALDQLVHAGNKTFAAFEREAFLPHILGVEKTLQALGRRQAVQNVAFFLGCEIGLAANTFKFLLPPALLVLVRHVHVFGTDGAAVGLAQRIEQLTQAHGVFAEESVAGVEHCFLVGVGETVKRRVQFGNVVAFGAFEGVQVGPAGTNVAVGGNQLLYCRALAAHFSVLAGHHDLGAALPGAFGKGIGHRQMRHILGVAAVYRGNMLECVEILAPVVSHAARVGEVVFVHLFDIGRVAAEEVGVALIA